MKKTYLLLGTNLGNRGQNLELAIKLLKENGLRILNTSFVYETAAWGYVEQPAFYNLAVEALTNYSPKELLKVVKSVENEMGRIKKDKWQERLIDIDILFFDNDVVSEDNLIIPHPELQNRRFALVPLLDITYDYFHPLLKKSVSQMLEECEDKLEVRRVK